MTSTRASKAVKRERQGITRTACEHCREKRAKCDGEKPCGRCQARHLDCRFTQRTWASKRSLQDEATSLREQIRRRDRLLDAICASEGSGDNILEMLREDGLSYDEAYEKMRDRNDASELNINTIMVQGRHDSTGSGDSETCSSPSTVHSNILSSTSRQSPFSFMDYTITDDTISQCSIASDQLGREPNLLHQQMNTVQSIPWATSAPDVNSFDTMLESTPLVPTVSTGVIDGIPIVSDPILWPPMTSSSPLDQTIHNSWIGMAGAPGEVEKDFCPQQ
jgi:hypothetical protein